ncbi:MAG: serine hydrolase, partial [Cyclobacteriaceae bacterium]|nr:serine hydrolase [Cyclobacteriaceae bacterium]
LILALEDNELYNSLVPQLIFGGIEADGLLPVTINETFQIGYGIPVSNLSRFSYAPPEGAGLNSERLKKIDSIAYWAIKEEAIPGCEILVAKDNQVVFKKSYGYQTYDSLQNVSDNDLYDLASITKVSGALPGLMKLYEEGKFDLDATLGTYLPYFKKGNKKELTFREILAHQSGIIPYIVFWKTAQKKSGKYRRKTLSITQSDDYNYKIADDLFMHKDYKRKIYKQIKKSKTGEKKYLYSGLTFYLFPEIIEAITGENYTDYIYSNFYKPLGATTLTYKPMEKFGIERIVPTEYDSLFRNLLVHGTVHDEGAAMMRGVSSNAGLFANANDLAKLFQMYCNYGTFGGREYLNEETVREFTTVQYAENENRRGLGFDRPLPEPHEEGNTAKSVSQLSFGHSGFTGTFAWADPEYNLVYIFLSNRVYPTRVNRKLYELNIRTNIQEVIYEAME